MRYMIEVPDAELHAALGAAAQSAVNMAELLGLVRVDNVAMGMMHQLGMVSALTMAGIPDNASEIRDHLLGLVGLGLIYLKALTPADPEPEIEDV